MASKPSLARGVRDFGTEEVRGREWIFSTIRQVFELHCFGPIETPAIEQMATLTGKYGEEGSSLLFRILNNGAYLADADAQILESKDEKALSPIISEKALRYDLTVPLARYVVMNRGQLTFPFKRYQIDRVWRADRPAKGRYREFYQCDADIIGSRTMVSDAECLLMVSEVMTQLGLPEYLILLNNRKVLQSLADVWGFGERFGEFAIAIDKWDKVGEEGVVRELGQRGFAESAIFNIQQLFRAPDGGIQGELQRLHLWLAGHELGMKGVQELEELIALLQHAGLPEDHYKLDLSLARGLDYYTSSIYEVRLRGRDMGSVASGGRYDELTAAFGVKDMPGVGISFGVERLYDILRGDGVLDQYSMGRSGVLVLNLEDNTTASTYATLSALRLAGIPADWFPKRDKLGKQLEYADKKRFAYALIKGGNELANNTYMIKNLETGDQQEVADGEVVAFLTAS